MSLTQARLKEVLSYNPHSGHFTSNYAIRGRAKGAVCGCHDKSSYSGYIRIRVDGVLYQAHRLAFVYMEGTFPIDQVGHINGDKTDNSWGNLREADAVVNSRNSKLYKTNTSGHVGVRFNEAMGKYTAEICVDGANNYLGSFHNMDDAIAARTAAHKHYDFHENHGMRDA